MSSKDMPEKSEKFFKRERVLNARGFKFVFASVVTVKSSGNRKKGAHSDAIFLCFKNRSGVSAFLGGGV